MSEAIKIVAQCLGYTFMFFLVLEFFSFVFAKAYKRDSTMVLFWTPSWSKFLETLRSFKFVQLDKNIHLADATWNDETNEYDFSYVFYNKLSDEEAEKIISKFKKNRFLVIVQVSEDNVPFDEE